jgi:hypothetical protein
MLDFSFLAGPGLVSFFAAPVAFDEGAFFSSFSV